MLRLADPWKGFEQQLLPRTISVLEHRSQDGPSTEARGSLSAEMLRQVTNDRIDFFLGRVSSARDHVVEHLAPFSLHEALVCEAGGAVTVRAQMDNSSLSIELGIRSIAVPVKNAGGETIAAMHIGVRVSRIPRADLIL